MKFKTLTPDEREQALLALTRQLLQEEISEGQLLRTLRREVLGLSQEAYARLVGISRRTLSDIERDAGNASLATLNRIFRPLGFKVGVIPRQMLLLKRVINEEA